MEEIASNLLAHMAIEEDIFYPAVKEIGTKKAEELVPEAYEEHHVAKLVIAELPKVDPEDERFEAKMTVLEELIEHHVEEEEKEMFKSAEKLGAERLDGARARDGSGFRPRACEGRGQGSRRCTMKRTLDGVAGRRCSRFPASHARPTTRATKHGRGGPASRGQHGQERPRPRRDTLTPADQAKGATPTSR